MEQLIESILLLVFFLSSNLLAVSALNKRLAKKECDAYETHKINLYNQAKTYEGIQQQTAKLYINNADRHITLFQSQMKHYRLLRNLSAIGAVGSFIILLLIH